MSLAAPLSNVRALACRVLSRSFHPGHCTRPVRSTPTNVPSSFHYGYGYQKASLAKVFVSPPRLARRTVTVARAAVAADGPGGEKKQQLSAYNVAALLNHCGAWRGVY